MSSQRSIALAYLDAFCKNDLANLAEILAPELRFEGTLGHYDSASAYLQLLQSDQPEVCRYEVLSVTEDCGSVANFYDYIKPDRRIKIAQLFKITEQKICEIHLVLDGRGFA